VGRLDENIPITTALETVALSCSSLCNRLDLYSPFGKLAPTAQHRAACHNGMANEQYGWIPGFEIDRPFCSKSNCRTYRIQLHYLMGVPKESA
jgi:hypothetical protein